ncbi:glycosyltransferase [Corynebacterium cystitidis]|uniref:glycosyltransferase n=1 Tax=Corynebacterium cystitidis TaxID=35757 RepID=UPI00211DD172|nr:glycosyltransferase [Corynebacterium cystitidis]
MKNIIVYGDVSPNVIDGSSIWLVSITEVLSKVFQNVHLQLKAKLENHRLISAIEEIPNVIVHEPVASTSGEMSADEARVCLEKLDQDIMADAVLVRGIDACNSVSMSNQLAGKLWSYVTELPFPPSKISKNNLNRLERISQRSLRLFAQTEAARSYYESLIPSAAGRVNLLPPMIPNDAYLEADENSLFIKEQLRLVYAGKLASGWRTYEMLDLPSALRKIGVDAELIVVGAKFNRNPKDPLWVDKMRKKLVEYSADPNTGVTWLGALPRDETIKHIAGSDFGISWRSPELDSSLEISTKALEYLAAGVAPIINRTADHELLFGEDYPLFVNAFDGVDAIAEIIKKGISYLNNSRDSLRSIARKFSFEQSRASLETIFSRGLAPSLAGNRREKDSKATKVVIASHDLKFMGELMDHLDRSSCFEVKLDPWDSLHHHDVERSKELANWADTVLCEWAGPNLKWYSQNKKPTSKLVSRLHRFELDNNAAWLADVDWDNVDNMVFVSDLYKRMAIEKLPISEKQALVIPNSVDSSDFDRPKTPDARFTLGFIGMVPYHKRPDRALRLLEALLAVDDRYKLRFKGRLPWEYSYEWKDPVQRQLYLEFFNKIAETPELRDAVIFDHFSPDVANWFRGIGFILSPSEVESFHMAPAEGMASRAWPLFWERPGVDEIFGARFLGGTISEMVQTIISCQDEEYFSEKGQEARDSVLRWDPMILMKKWEQTLA